MSPFPLLTGLRQYLASHLAAMPLGSHMRKGNAIEEESEARPCAFLIGSMPPTAQDALSAAPFALLQIMEGGRQEPGVDVIRLAIRVCIVAHDPEAAENDLLNLISQIRLWIYALPGGVIARTFRLDPECALEWSRPDEQVPPFLQAYIFSDWQTRAAGREVAMNMVDYE